MNAFWENFGHPGPAGQFLAPSWMFEYVGRFSPQKKSDKSNYSDADYREFAYRKIDDGFDLVIMGHTHWPVVEKYKHGWYLNAGNWIDAFTHLEIEDSIPRLLQWDGEMGVDYKITFPPGNTGN